MLTCWILLFRALSSPNRLDAKIANQPLAHLSALDHTLSSQTGDIVKAAKWLARMLDPFCAA